MKTALFLFAIALTNFSSPASAAQTVAPTDRSKMTMNPSREDREKMATAHEQMADCLRSEHEFLHCHDALHEECQSMMGGSCPGMEKGMKHKKSN